MIVNVASVAPTIRRLRLREGDLLIAEACLDEEFAPILIQFIEALANLEIDLLGKQTRVVPLNLISAKYVTVNLLDDDVADLLCFREHVFSAIEEPMLDWIVNLGIANATDCFTGLKNE